MPYQKRLCACGDWFVPRARENTGCRRCRSGAPRDPVLVPPPANARILFFDIETAGVNALKSDLGFAVCFGYKWNDEPEAHCITSRKRDLAKFNDAWLLERAADVFERADLVVGHFASVFDRRFLQGRLLINQLPPIPPTKMRDTCMIARSAANFSSNRLKHLSGILNLSAKKQEKRAGSDWPGWWYRVMQGDMKALAAMAEYCEKDVLATEALYYRLLGFDNAHPRVVSDRKKCGVCGGRVIVKGFKWDGGRRYRRTACTLCKRWDRERESVKP